MNDDQHTTALHERVERAPDWPERDETPREGETSALARHRDPSLTKDTTEAAKKQRPGVEWVRPTDLLVRSSGTLAGRGIEFNSEQGRRFRSSLVTGARSVSERAKRLPPLSAFGRRGQHVEGPARSGVGMR